MNFEVSQRFHFDAAHSLQREIDTVSSARIHGHTYHAEVTIAGTPDAQGMVVDLGIVRREIASVQQQLDHHLLDEVPGLGPATLENLCRFISAQLRPRFAGLASVSVWRESVGDSCRLTIS
ncbi:MULTISPECIES: 6-carboxytetrahydropterin synthase [Ramlibacter]|uniref:6-carboxy-5,6,7,8-tetrahydropterin synthase n=1 Tax=Ramlibacter aquaticus TaxID=2780094 RepID=A0ABR9SDT5_9BURK|nr:MULTISPECIES: 6-carboxytetrahydropterin synthase [Ramlibacter]MBE7940379.1 6-carboxytetrahydropterin synthase [Ramlibacter aquaticus]